MNAIALIIALVAQATDLPAYLRSDADVERREVTVEFVHDGDTFRGDDGVDYRLAGINAPEVAHPEHGKPEGEPGGEEASVALSTLISGRRITALIDRAIPTDRYGRTVAVIVANNQDVNIEMLRSGLAEPRYIDLSPMIDAAAFLNAAPTLDTTRLLAPSDVGHLLAPGDRIRILVGDQSQDFTINPDGEILIKGLGVMPVGGKTSIQATADLDTAIRAKGITVSPLTIFYLSPPAKINRTAVVIGAVKKSGTYPATTLIGAISAAEGFTPDANLTDVRMTIADSTTIVNATRILAGVDRDLTLEGGEVIVVPTLPKILVSGAVAKPNWVTALTFSEAISATGGPVPEADLSNVELRTGADSTTRVDAQAIFSGRADDIRLNDRDRITIPIRPRALVPLVQVYGPVQLPGTQEAFTIADAIREARSDTRADLENVIVDRGAGDTTVVNARDIALGHDADQDLKTGDRVLIPRRPESIADTPQTVTVLGDVAKPGSYPPGTLTQVLAAAGGTNPTAQLATIRVRDSSGNSTVHSLHKISAGRAPDPHVTPNSTIVVESSESSRQGMADLRTILGIIGAVVLLLSRSGS